MKLEDSTFQKFDEEVKENKIELIVDIDRKQEIVIIKHIVENPIEVKYDDVLITHNPQVQVDL